MLILFSFLYIAWKVIEWLAVSTVIADNPVVTHVYVSGFTPWAAVGLTRGVRFLIIVLVLPVWWEVLYPPVLMVWHPEGIILPGVNLNGLSPGSETGVVIRAWPRSYRTVQTVECTDVALQSRQWRMMILTRH